MKRKHSSIQYVIAGTNINYTHYDLGHDVHESPKAIYLHLYPSIKLYSNSPIAKAKDEIMLVIDE